MALFCEIIQEGFANVTAGHHISINLLLSNILTDRKSLCCYSRGAAKRPLRGCAFWILSNLRRRNVWQKALGSPGFVDLIEGLSQRVANQRLARYLYFSILDRFSLGHNPCLGRARAPRSRAKTSSFRYFNERSRPTAFRRPPASSLAGANSSELRFRCVAITEIAQRSLQRVCRGRGSFGVDFGFLQRQNDLLKLPNFAFFLFVRARHCWPPQGIRLGAFECRSFPSILAMMSFAVSGCSLRNYLAASRPWPMRSPL